jgi:hypothetical protein
MDVADGLLSRQPERGRCGHRTLCRYRHPDLDRPLDDVHR